MGDSTTSIDNIPTVTSATFERLVLQGDGPIAVEFMSYSCAYCGAMEPIIQQAAEMLSGKETIFRVNIALELDLAESFEIQGTPTIIMFLNGSEVGRAEGAHPNISSLLAELTQPFGA